MAYPSEQAATEAVDAVQPPARPRLHTMQGLTLYVYEDGSAQAFHNRLDMHQYKIVTTRLADQDLAGLSQVEVAASMVAAAAELFEDSGGLRDYTD